MNKVMRYQIIKPIDIDWKTFGDILNKLRQEVRFTKQLLFITTGLLIVFSTKTNIMNIQSLLIIVVIKFFLDMRMISLKQKSYFLTRQIIQPL